MKALIVVMIFGLAAPALADLDTGTKVLSASGGRFVYGQTSMARADQFLLDTQTGNLWHLISIDVEGREVLTLERIRFINDGNGAGEQKQGTWRDRSIPAKP